MPRSVVALLVLLTAVMLPAIPSAAGAATGCAEVAAYIARVDETLATGMADLASDAGLREAYASATRQAGTDGTGLLALSPDEQHALIAYIAVPGDALAAIDDTDIPAAIADLHASAMTHWETMPAMMRAVVEDGPSAAFAFTGDLATAAETNALAANAVRDACPGEIAAWAEASSAWSAAQDPDAGDLGRWAGTDPTRATGAGYQVIFYTEVVPDATPQASPASR